MNLGFAFYAKFFKTQGECAQPIGCATVELEDANGGDTGQSGAITFLENPAVLASGQADTDEGGQWYWDPSTSYFWTWDTPDFVAQKFDQIVKARGLGGVSKFNPSSFRFCLLERKHRGLMLTIVFRSGVEFGRGLGGLDLYQGSTGRFGYSMSSHNSLRFPNDEG